MRPDEHKKRKKSSGQDKKKHVISDKNDGKSNRSSNVTSNKVVRDVGNSDYREVDKDVNTVQFSRRKVISNWAKYEIPEDDPYLEIEKKGENFEKLLHSAGGSDSQFQFKDEAFWGEALSEFQANQMTVDLQSLANNMCSLTLCQKFDLTKEHFTDNQLEVMKGQMQQTAESINVSRFSPPGQKTNSNTTNLPTIKQTNTIKTLSQEVVTESAAIDREEFNAQPAVNDHDLDSLVSVATAENSSYPKQQQNAADSNDDLEDWLDSVLD